MAHVHAAQEPHKSNRSPISFEDYEPPAVTVDVLNPDHVMPALPAELRRAFLARPADGFIRLEHNNPHASPSLRGEQLVDAQRALTAAGYCVWPNGWGLEVSGHESPHYIASEHESCPVCGAPSPDCCRCHDEDGAYL